MPGIRIHDGDLCGKFGVRLYKRLDKDNTGHWLGEFICPNCGEHFISRVENVARGDRKSCGCLYKQNNKRFGQLNTKDLLGQRFGKLLVVQKTDKRKDGRIVWKCKCDCGNIIEVTSHNLLNGHTKSCGCLHQETGKYFKKDLTSKIFGYLKVIKDTGKTYKTKGQSHAIWLCQCLRDGNFIEVRSDSLINNHIVSCGCCQWSFYSKKIADYLTELNISYVSEKTFEDCVNPKTNTRLRFDFYLPDYDICIEYDGEQHYQEVNFCSDTLLDRQFRDNLKDEYCRANNIKLVRIPYFDKKQISLNYIKQKLFGE